MILIEMLPAIIGAALLVTSVAGHDIEVYTGKTVELTYNSRVLAYTNATYSARAEVDLVIIRYYQTFTKQDKGEWVSDDEAEVWSCVKAFIQPTDMPYLCTKTAFANHSPD